MPPAFVLSQDQTLRLTSRMAARLAPNRHPSVTPSQTRNRSHPSPSPDRPDPSSLPQAQAQAETIRATHPLTVHLPLPQEPEPPPAYPFSFIQQCQRTKQEDRPRPAASALLARAEERAYTPAQRAVSNAFNDGSDRASILPGPGPGGIGQTPRPTWPVGVIASMFSMTQLTPRGPTAPALTDDRDLRGKSG